MTTDEYHVSLKDLRKGTIVMLDDDAHRLGIVTIVKPGKVYIEFDDKKYSAFYSKADLGRLSLAYRPHDIPPNAKITNVKRFVTGRVIVGIGEKKKARKLIMRTEIYSGNEFFSDERYKKCHGELTDFPEPLWQSG